jgi:hypothetical protein
MVRETKINQKDIGGRTSTARGEIPIISVSPSSPVLGFCITLLAGRADEEEKEAACWRNGDRDIDRGMVVL